MSLASHLDCRAAGAEDAPTIAKALGCEPQGLMELGRGKALFRTLLRGHPTEPLPLSMEKTELPTGRLQTNVRTTRANFARPRRKAEELMRPRRERRGWGNL